MVAMDSNTRSELAEHPAGTSAVAGIVHGLVFVIPVWLVIASVVVVSVLR
ncbi:hypothetical protein [Labedella populi]|nr:hypothetical protein [Labedella populi]